MTDPIAAARVALCDQMWLRLIQLACQHRLQLQTCYVGYQWSLTVRDEFGTPVAGFGAPALDDTVEHVLGEVATKMAARQASP